VIEYLEFFAAAYRITGPARRKKCDEMLEIVDLDFKRDAFANTLSRGQTQRLGLARVLLHDPQVLLLDEPLSGLDPRARIEMRNLLRRLGKTGKTIIVSSHILPELADICNKIGIIDRGVMSVSAEVTEVMKQVRDRTILQIAVAGESSDTQNAAEKLRIHPLVDSLAPGDGFLSATLIDNTSDYSEIPTMLVEEGFRIKLFREEEINLESAFMALTKGTGANF
jgi:ABC-2 type transport system ATP-binding protein